MKRRNALAAMVAVLAGCGGGGGGGAASNTDPIAPAAAAPGPAPAASPAPTEPTQPPAAPAPQPPLARLLSAVKASDGLGVVAHPTVTATITQTANGALPSGLTCFPSGSTAPTTSDSPAWLDADVFSHYGPHTFLANAFVAGAANLNFPLRSFPGEVRFRFSGRYLHLLTTFGGKTFNILLDGKSVGAYTTPPGTSNAWLAVDFGALVSGELALLCTTDSFIGAVGIKSEATISAADGAGVTAWNISDSYGGFPCSAISAGHGMLRNAMYRLGVNALYVDQVGGTGYLYRNNTYQNALERLPAAIAQQPDVLWTQMGINDPDPGVAPLEAQVREYYRQARAGLPDAVLITQTGWAPKETWGAAAKARVMAGYILDALAAVGGPWIFVDNMTGGWVTSAGTRDAGPGVPWQTGNGDMGAPTGSGNGDLYVSADGTHPSPAGTDYLEKLLAANIRAAALSMAS